MADKMSREGVKVGKDEYGQRYVEYEDGTRAYAINADSVTATQLHESREGNKVNIGELKTKLRFDTSDLINAIKILKAIQREAKKATADLKEAESLTKSKYLVIELDELESVPKVFYKGEEINNKEKVGFNWDTANQTYPNRTNICIDYFDVDGMGMPVSKGIHELKGARYAGLSRGDYS